MASTTSEVTEAKKAESHEVSNNNRAELGNRRKASQKSIFQTSAFLFKYKVCKKEAVYVMNKRAASAAL